ncbi:MAG: type IV pilus modification PilV family protein [Planctomycetota bacterium]|jgi:hypothetical protein
MSNARTRYHPTRPRGRRRPIPRARGGFTLIETALATVIVGLGVIAIMAAQQSFHQQNGWSTHASIATRLGNEIREMSLNLPRHDPVTGIEFWGPEENELSFADYDDLDDFDGQGGGLIFSADLGNGPVNAYREIIPNMEGWEQIVRVFNVDPFDIRFDSTNYGGLPPDASTKMILVVVEVSYEGERMTTVSWIAPK